MDKKSIRADGLLLLTAAIWGFAFVAQRVGMDYAGPFTFGAVRFLLGALSLVPLILVIDRKAKNEAKNEAAASHSGAACRTAKLARHKLPVSVEGQLVRASLLAGVCLFIASGFQQIGLYWTTAGNSGFITGVYVVMVPVAGVFLGRKTGLPTWIGALLTFAGLFLVSGIVGGGTAAGGSGLNRGDVLTFISGLFWTCHVLVIDRLVKKTPALKLSCGQFVVCGILSLAAAAFNLPARIGMGTPPEIFSAGFTASSLLDAAIPILYGGICSVGIAYTLQVVAQQWAHPAHASIILCLESVFATIGGVLLLSEKPSLITLIGFGLMLTGMIASQADVFGKKPS